MKICGLGYLGFESPAAATWREFAPPILGAELADGAHADTTYLRLDDRHHRIAIHPADVDRLSYIGWETRSRRDFEEALQTLTKMGVTYSEASADELEDRCVFGMAHLLSPGGFRYEIFYGQGERTGSFYPGRPHQGFVTGDEGLGHVVLVTPTLEDDHLFAEEVFGFRTVTRIGPVEKGLAFYRCNPRHHSLAFVGRPGRRGLMHLMIQALSLDDVGIALDRAQDAGMEVPVTLGRHPGDLMVSFYLRTPSHFDIEYGWGGVRVDDEDTVVETRWLGHPDIWGHRRTGRAIPPNVRDIADASA